MEFEIVGKPEFLFRLSRLELDCLIILARAHPNRAHLMAAIGEEDGPGIGQGLLMVWSSRLERDSKATIQATLRQMELLVSLTGSPRGDHAAIGQRLHVSFQAAMDHYHETLVGIWKTTVFL